MVEELKTKFYSIIEGLGYTVYDNPYLIEGRNRNLPYVQIRTQNINRVVYHTSFVNAVQFKIDFWSKYSGEKEMLDMEQKVADALSQLYELDSVVFVAETRFQILDDKSTGTVMKHGIGIYQVALAGKETEDGNNTSN